MESCNQIWYPICWALKVQVEKPKDIMWRGLKLCVCTHFKLQRTQFLHKCNDPIWTPPLDSSHIILCMHRAQNVGRNICYIIILERWMGEKHILQLVCFENRIFSWFSIYTVLCLHPHSTKAKPTTPVFKTCLKTYISGEKQHYCCCIHMSLMSEWTQLGIVFTHRNHLVHRALPPIRHII